MYSMHMATPKIEPLNDHFFQIFLRMCTRCVPGPSSGTGDKARKSMVSKERIISRYEGHIQGTWLHAGGADFPGGGEEEEEVT